MAIVPRRMSRDRRCDGAEGSLLLYDFVDNGVVLLLWPHLG
eukprot:COSAG02_NODE_35297_length_470_cov_3.981132_1_plen_40_part_10